MIKEPHLPTRSTPSICDLDLADVTWKDYRFEHTQRKRLWDDVLISGLTSNNMERSDLHRVQFQEFQKRKAKPLHFRYRSDAAPSSIGRLAGTFADTEHRFNRTRFIGVQQLEPIHIIGDKLAAAAPVRVQSQFETQRQQHEDLQS